MNLIALNEAIKKRGTKKELSKMMNMPYKTLLMRCKGKTDWTVNELLKVSNILNFSDSEILEILERR